MFGIRKILLSAAIGVVLLLPGAGIAPAFALQESAPALQEDVPAAMVDETPFADLSLALASWTDGTTLKLMRDNSTQPLTVPQTKTLDLNGFTLSLGEEQSGSVITVSSGVLTLTDSGGSGKITGGNAEKGGGVFVDSHGSLLISGGQISGNTAREDGGGIYVSGRLTLSGNAVIKDNSNADGAPSNIFLTNRNYIYVSNFSGTAGVTLSDPGQPFTDGEEEIGGEFFSDDSEYIVRGGKFVVAPLKSVTAVFEPQGEIFPTTPLSALKEWVTLTGLNVNGAPYVHDITFTLSGSLKVGESVLTVTAAGVLPEEEETSVTAEVTVFAAAPRLLSFEVLPPEYPQTVYFDTPVEEVRFSVRGSYSDGHSRDIFTTPSVTAEQNGEPYITDFYVVSGKLSERTEGYATVTVTVSDLFRSYRVEVSRYSLDAREFTIKDVTVVKKSGAWGISYEWFVPDLPEGIEVEATIGGERFTGSELAVGVYTVELSFHAADAENYEVTGTRTATLTVNRESFYVTNSAHEVVASFTSEDGIPPAWTFTVEEGESIRNPALEGDWEPLQVSELTLFRPEEGSSGELTVRLLLGEKARGRELKLFRVREDGSLEEVPFTQDGNYLQFTGSDFLETRYVVAADSGFSLYFGLSVGFGVVCALAAVVLLGYLVHRGKFGR